MQSFEAALRMLLASPKLVTAVLVFTVPLALTTPTSRGSAAAVVPVMLLTPGTASYPGTSRQAPLPDNVISPSELAVPLVVSGLLEPLAAVGIASDATGAAVAEPVGANSSRLTAVEAELSAAAPVPVR